MYMAPEEVILLLVIDFRDELTTAEINQAIVRIRATIRQKYPIVNRVFIEPGTPAEPSHAQQAGMVR